MARESHQPCRSLTLGVFAWLAILVGTLISRPVFASDAGEWLKKVAHVPAKGVTEWTLVLTTDHFGNDWGVAQATRDAAITMLREAGSKGDTVRVVKAEMMTWGKPKTVKIEDMKEEDLPRNRAPKSHGGHDIEAILEELAPATKGPILVLASGDSEVPIDGRGHLKGGDGNVDGFDPPAYLPLVVETSAGSKKIHVKFLTKTGLFIGDTLRQPLKEVKDKLAPAPQKSPITPANLSEKSSGGVPSQDNRLLFLIAILGVFSTVGAFLIGRSRQVSQPPIVSPSSEELDKWKAEVKLQQRKFDMLAQELSEVVNQLDTEKEVAMIALRQQIAQQEKTLKTWDESAMDYLDGIDRALTYPDLNTEHREVFLKTGVQFAKYAQRAGLDIIAPSIGDVALDGYHRIEEVVPPTSTCPTDTVAGLLAQGYRRGERVLRLARIQLSGE